MYVCTDKAQEVRLEPRHTRAHGPCTWMACSAAAARRSTSDSRSARICLGGYAETWSEIV